MSLQTAYVADMRCVLIRLIATTASVFGFLLGGVAWADQSPDPTRLPVVIASSGADHSVIVEKGDHLWKMSGHHLQSVLGRPATNTEISPYWRRVVDTNRPNLRSGNPDLIYPGEVVTLPAVSG
jgi:nucleoid-associated protein YgaU